MEATEQIHPVHPTRPLDGFCIIDTENADEYRALVASKFDALRFDSSPHPQGFRVKTNHVQLATMGFGFCDHGTECEIGFRESDIIRHWICLDGRSEVLISGNHRLLTPGKSCTADGGSPTTVRFGRNFSQFALRMSRSALREKLQALSGMPPAGDVRFDQGETDAKETLALRRAVSYLACELDSAQSVSSIAAHELEQMILVLFLRASRHNFSDVLRAEPQSIAPWQVRLAEDFIEANWQQAITVEQLAETTQVSARSLFEYFRRYRGCSPMAFVRRVRLQNAKGLLSTPTASTTVTGIALLCGFMNAGHFSRHYSNASANCPRRPLPGRGHSRSTRTRTGSTTPSCPERDNRGIGAPGRYFKNSGEIRFGRNSDTFGHTITSPSTMNMGISIKPVSLMASLIRMPAIEQAIIRQSP